MNNSFQNNYDPLDDNQYRHMNHTIRARTDSDDTPHKDDTIYCCNRKIDTCIGSYFTYLFFVALFLTNVCNIILNYKLLNK